MSRLQNIGAISALVLAVMALPAAAGDCFINGAITASMTTGDLSLGRWQYTLEVSWDTGQVYGLSHLDLLVDKPGGNCLCGDIAAALAFAQPAGLSDGVPAGGTVVYDAVIECSLEPTIPNLDGIYIKWEMPAQSGGCEPGPAGTGVFTFYCDLGPYPITEDVLIFLRAGMGHTCAGSITGVFPDIPCGPIATTETSWTAVKGIFGR